MTAPQNRSTTAPKTVLHDHLDGGLRPGTVVDLAAAAGYSGIPVPDDQVARFFEEGARGSLEQYLTYFEHTIAIMQSAEALRRVAKESVIDHAAEGVVYAEIRMAPSLHLQGGLTRDEAIGAALEGLAQGQEEAGIAARLIISAMRGGDGSVADAEAAARFRDRGVIGFDLAGPEAGFAAGDHSEALELAVHSGLHLTIHAGEGAGVASIAEALDCGAERIGHGVRLIEDITVDDGEMRLGPTAERVRGDRIALEICIKSNVDTRATRSFATHPIDVLHRAGFVTTINTDNRLMSMTSMSREFELAATHKGFTLDDFRTVTLNAVEAAFCDSETKEEIRSRVHCGYNEFDQRG